MRRAGVVILILLAVSGLTGVALADNESPIKSANDVVTVLGNILTWVGRIFWIFAVGATLYAGFLYLTAAGNTERVGKAKKQLVYVVIAIVIGLLAWGLPAIIKNILTPSGANGSGNGNNGDPPAGAQCINASDCVCDSFSTPQCLTGQCFCN